MKILGFTLSKEEPKKEIVADSFNTFSFSRPELPVISESRNNEWVNFGVDNMYPETLKDYMASSAMHGAIVIGKSKMMSGTGLLINGAESKDQNKNIYDALPADVKQAWDYFTKNPQGEPLTNIIQKLSYDWQVYGQFALEVVWSLDFSRIALIKYVNVANVRAGKLVNDRIDEYYYSRDWTKARQEEPTRIAAFSPENKTDYNQLIFVKNGNEEYYGIPPYRGCLSWVKIESQLGLFHLSNIENGFAPSLSFKFYKQPGSPEERQMILTNIKKQFSGAKNAGKALIFFSDGKDLAPDVAPIQVDNLDKQFLLLADQAVQQILSGHRVTSPLLFGISVPGQLGGNSELKSAFEIFDSTVIEPDRNVLETVLNLLLETNKIPITVEIDRFVPIEMEEETDPELIAIAINSAIPREQRINILTELFELDLETAQKIVGPETTQPNNPTA